MRRLWCVVFALCGCNGLFEDNPDFVEDATAGATAEGGGRDSTTAAAADDQADETTMGTAADDDDGSGSAGVQCEPDPYEFNDEDGEAAALPDIATMGGSDGEVEAVLEGTGAVDWYVFNGTQLEMDIGRAKAVVDDANLRVCAYLKCDDLSAVAVDCGADEPSTSPSDLPGCCGLGQAFPNHQCSGQPGGDVRVWVRVSDAMDRNACLPYALDYSFRPA